jgi:hypothetical protein
MRFLLFLGLRVSFRERKGILFGTSLVVLFRKERYHYDQGVVKFYEEVPTRRKQLHLSFALFPNANTKSVE